MKNGNVNKICIYKQLRRAYDIKQSKFTYNDSFETRLLTNVFEKVAKTVKKIVNREFNHYYTPDF